MADRSRIECAVGALGAFTVYRVQIFFISFARSYRTPHRSTLLDARANQPFGKWSINMFCLVFDGMEFCSRVGSTREVSRCLRCYLCQRNILLHWRIHIARLTKRPFVLRFNSTLDSGVYVVKLWIEMNFVAFSAWVWFFCLIQSNRSRRYLHDLCLPGFVNRIITMYQYRTHNVKFVVMNIIPCYIICF